jgi:hypothetical protein
VNPSSTLDDLHAEIGEEIAGDCWVDVFDWAADERVEAPSAVLTAAIKGVKSEDAAVRVAASRVLSRSGQEALIAVAADAESRETNAYVKRAMRSAIRVSRA